MAKLYFRYGTMDCSKTAIAITNAFNYEEKGLSPLLLRPKTGKNPEKVMKGKIGLSRECSFVEDFIFYDMKGDINKKLKSYDVIIIDDVQFVDPDVIDILRDIPVVYNIPVICYGLRDDFQQNPFPSSMRLFVMADVVEELKTVCWCGDGARCNARLDDEGNVVYEGVQFDPSFTYTALCRKHYLEGNIGPKMKAGFAKKAEEAGSGGNNGRPKEDIPKRETKEETEKAGNKEAPEGTGKEEEKKESSFSLSSFFGKGNYEEKEGRISFRHVIDKDRIIIETDDVIVVKGEKVLVVGEKKGLYLKGWQVAENSGGPAMGSKKYLVKLYRKYFKPYEFKEIIRGFEGKKDADFDGLKAKAEESERA